MLYFNPKFSDFRDTLDKHFELSDISVFIPLYYEGNIAAIINLSSKLDNSAYSTQDNIVLSKLKKIITIVLHNIILFEKEQEAKNTKRELTLASAIQESIFQKEIPEFKGLDVYGYLKPALGVSGDYFLVEKISDSSMGVLIADVSGKGFSAALMAMVIHTISKSLVFSPKTTNAIVSRINEMMTKSQENSGITKIMSFATVFCGFIDGSAKKMYYTNAGHHPVIIYDIPNDEFEYIHSDAKPAGIFPGEYFPIDTYKLKKDQIIVIYSDGITEALNKAEEEFGIERLNDLIKFHRGKTAKDITNEIIRNIEAYAFEREQFDDMTLIVVKI